MGIQMKEKAFEILVDMLISKAVRIGNIHDRKFPWTEEELNRDRELELMRRRVILAYDENNEGKEHGP